MKTNFFYLYISCLFLLGTALFGSCQDDDDFTTSSTSKLTFEAETIKACISVLLSWKVAAPVVFVSMLTDIPAPNCQILKF